MHTVKKQLFMTERTKLLFVTIVIIGLFNLSCNKNDIEPQTRELVGDWTWTASCGGFSGNCKYPDTENYKSVQITVSQFTEKVNGTTTIDMSYEIMNTEISETNYPYEVAYGLKLENGQILNMTLFKKKNKLIIWSDDILSAINYEGK